MDSFINSIKPATEETLQSIDSTLKRIADILEEGRNTNSLQRIKESFEDALRQPLQLHLRTEGVQTLSEQTDEQKYLSN